MHEKTDHEGFITFNTYACLCARMIQYLSRCDHLFVPFILYRCLISILLIGCFLSIWPSCAHCTVCHAYSTSYIALLHGHTLPWIIMMHYYFSCKGHSFNKIDLCYSFESINMKNKVFLKEYGYFVHGVCGKRPIKGTGIGTVRESGVSWCAEWHGV